jgi:hypothetical protein
MRRAAAKVERIGEMLSVYYFIAGIRLQWERRADAQALPRAFDVAGKALPVGGHRIMAEAAGVPIEDAPAAFAEVAVELAAEDAATNGAADSMLLAATRWIAGLNLPTTEAALFFGPAVLDRPRRD